MRFLNKFRGVYGRHEDSRSDGATARAHDRPGPSAAPRVARPSNGLKQFLRHLDGIGKGSLLDLGPAWQATVSFFIERGFKVYTEDVLDDWKEFLREEENRLRNTPPGERNEEGVSGVERANRFLSASLQYPPQTFDAVLVWDVLDYLDAELVARMAKRITGLLKDGGAILAVFHSRRPEGFQRYRVLDPQNLELIPAPALLPVRHILQNREILDLFGGMHDSRTFVRRDQLREGLFIK